MSLRAMCAWLSSEKGVAASASTLSRMMRNSDAYWQGLHDLVEVAAVRFGECCGRRPQDVLTMEDEEFELLWNDILRDKKLEAGNEPDDELADLWDAADILAKEWFALPLEAQNECLSRVRAMMSEEEVEQEQADAEEDDESRAGE